MQLVDQLNPYAVLRGKRFADDELSDRQGDRSQSGKPLFASIGLLIFFPAKEAYFRKLAGVVRIGDLVTYRKGVLKAVVGKLKKQK